jgi:hypothetical protein
MQLDDWLKWQLFGGNRPLVQKQAEVSANARGLACQPAAINDDLRTTHKNKLS